MWEPWPHGESCVRASLGSTENGFFSGTLSVLVGSASISQACFKITIF